MKERQIDAKAQRRKEEKWGFFQLKKQIYRLKMPFVFPFLLCASALWGQSALFSIVHA